MATGKFLDQLNTIGVASLVGGTDLFPVYDDSATEHKAIAASDVLKRWLSTSDVSWLSTLAVSSIVPANDKFLVWDADATAIKVITASDLLNYTLAGTSVSGIGELGSLTLVNGSADYVLVYDASANLWKKLVASALLNALAYAYGGAVVSTPTTPNVANSGKRYSNYGATQVIEFDMPTATVGLKYAFQRIADYAIRVDPNGSETIGEGGAGKYLEVTARGAVAIECFVAGAWEVVGGSSVYTFET